MCSWSSLPMLVPFLRLESTLIMDQGRDNCFNYLQKLMMKEKFLIHRFVFVLISEAGITGLIIIDVQGGVVQFQSWLKMFIMLGWSFIIFITFYIYHYLHVLHKIELFSLKETRIADII